MVQWNLFEFLFRFFFFTIKLHRNGISFCSRVIRNQSQKFYVKAFQFFSHSKLLPVLASSSSPWYSYFSIPSRHYISLFPYSFFPICFYIFFFIFAKYMSQIVFQRPKNFTTLSPIFRVYSAVVFLGRCARQVYESWRYSIHCNVTCYTYHTAFFSVFSHDFITEKYIYIYSKWNNKKKYKCFRRMIYFASIEWF